MKFPASPKYPVPSELVETQAVLAALRQAGVEFFAVPNGGRRSPGAQVQAKREGMSPGVPDIIIPSGSRRAVQQLLALVPEGRRGEAASLVVGLAAPVALEMKRARGGRVSPEQQAWHERLRAAGWVVIVGRGAADALQQLRDHGLDVW